MVDTPQSMLLSGNQNCIMRMPNFSSFINQQARPRINLSRWEIVASSHCLLLVESLLQASCLISKTELAQLDIDEIGSTKVMVILLTRT